MGFCAIALVWALEHAAVHALVHAMSVSMTQKQTDEQVLEVIRKHPQVSPVVCSEGLQQASCMHSRRPAAWVSGVLKAATACRQCTSVVTPLRMLPSRATVPLCHVYLQRLIAPRPPRVHAIPQITLPAKGTCAPPNRQRAHNLLRCGTS